jgi:hypothetical protein
MVGYQSIKRRRESCKWPIELIGKAGSSIEDGNAPKDSTPRKAHGKEKTLQ